MKDIAQKYFDSTLDIMARMYREEEVISLGIPSSDSQHLYKNKCIHHIVENLPIVSRLTDKGELHLLAHGVIQTDNL